MGILAVLVVVDMDCELIAEAALEEVAPLLVFCRVFFVLEVVLGLASSLTTPSIGVMRLPPLAEVKVTVTAFILGSNRRGEVSAALTVILLRDRPVGSQVATTAAAEEAIVILSPRRA